MVFTLTLLGLLGIGLLASPLATTAGAVESARAAYCVMFVQSFTGHLVSPVCQSGVGSFHKPSLGVDACQVSAVGDQDVVGLVQGCDGVHNFFGKLLTTLETGCVSKYPPRSRVLITAQLAFRFMLTHGLAFMVG